MADDPSGFEIDGEVYEVPRLDSLDLDEEQILYDLSGIVQPDFAPLHPDSSEEEKALHQAAIMMRIRNPKFKRALVHIAYRRRHPEADDIEVHIGKVNALDAEIALYRGEDEDPPQSSPKPQDDRKSGSETSRSTDSGSPSGSDSDAQAKILGPIGTGASATSSPELGLTTSAS